MMMAIPSLPHRLHSPDLDKAQAGSACTVVPPVLSFPKLKLCITAGQNYAISDAAKKE